MTNNPLMDLRRLDEEKRRKSASDSDPALNSSQETNVTTLQDYNEASNEERNEARLQATRVAEVAVAPGRKRATGSKTLSPASAPGSEQLGTAPPEGRRELPPSVPDTREERLTAAMQLAQEDEPGVVTIRISPRLNAYIDRYVQRVNQIEPKRRYRKQDAVAEAFAAFYADHPMPPSPKGEDDL